MTDVATNPYLSGCHADSMQRELAAARTEAEMQQIAAKHTRFLLGKHLAVMRDVYAARLKRVRKENRA
ncbi:MAG: hypothetical protein LBQ81_12360 [Zoogloeaceae bacterium]|jgi:hypothetical protein|nr:hypothetical protein [Zoogloeaceae bacterium]